MFRPTSNNDASCSVLIDGRQLLGDPIGFGKAEKQGQTQQPTRFTRRIPIVTIDSPTMRKALELQLHERHGDDTLTVIVHVIQDDGSASVLVTGLGSEATRKTLSTRQVGQSIQELLGHERQVIESCIQRAYFTGPQ